MEAAANPAETKKRVSYGIRWGLAVALAIAAALSYFGYVANGMVVGDLVGLPGRDSDIAVAQHYAVCWLVAFAVLQVGLITAIFSVLRFGTDATRLARLINRAAIAAFLSIPVTLTAGTIVFAVLQLGRRFWPHLR